jgi:hypothetical protein
MQRARRLAIRVAWSMAHLPPRASTSPALTVGPLEDLADQHHVDGFLIVFGYSSLVDSGAAQLGGRSGFRVEARMARSSAAERMLCYGAVDGDWLYLLSYEALEDEYFARDSATFDTVRSTFHIAPH